MLKRGRILAMLGMAISLGTAAPLRAMDGPARVAGVDFYLSISPSAGCT